MKCSSRLSATTSLSHQSSHLISGYNLSIVRSSADRECMKTCLFDSSQGRSSPLILLPSPVIVFQHSISYCLRMPLTTLFLYICYGPPAYLSYPYMQNFVNCSASRTYCRGQSSADPALILFDALRTLKGRPAFLVASPALQCNSCLIWSVSLLLNHSQAISSYCTRMFDRSSTLNSS